MFGAPAGGLGGGGGFGNASAAGKQQNNDFELTSQGGPTNSISTVATGMVAAGMIPGTTAPTNGTTCSLCRSTSPARSICALQFGFVLCSSV